MADCIHRLDSSTKCVIERTESVVVWAMTPQQQLTSADAAASKDETKEPEKER